MRFCVKGLEICYACINVCRTYGHNYINIDTGNHQKRISNFAINMIWHEGYKDFDITALPACFKGNLLPFTLNMS